MVRLAQWHSVPQQRHGMRPVTFFAAPRRATAVKVPDSVRFSLKVTTPSTIPTEVKGVRGRLHIINTSSILQSALISSAPSVGNE
ncbi:hypothetical protein J6590_075178 [Homalodisca vitripennis]|nr:hypothetical protein J6590_075178 [Homalodisca vitripennis]